MECHPLDLASFSSVRSFAKRAVKGAPVSAIIHNAGVMAPPYSTTIDGHELTFQVRVKVVEAYSFVCYYVLSRSTLGVCPFEGSFSLCLDAPGAARLL